MKHVRGAIVVALAAVPLVVLQPHAASRPTALHVLNRITFGPRPGDVVRVEQMGVERFIREQLHPEHLDDSDVLRRLERFETLRLSSREIAGRYEIPAVQARRARQRAASADSAAEPGRPDPAMDARTRQRANLPLIELSEQKIVRAVHGDRQLEEVLTDFWFNHFNVDARKGPVRYMLTEYEREAIRPHMLGRFRDLLGATAKSPAMLFYLDNWLSAAPNSEYVRLKPDATPARPRAGLNENYARELLELHTLGVDGGYTQKDVTEVARAFTGWTIQNPRLGGGFRFAPALHDDGEKVVLGHRIRAGGGEHDGEEVLDIVARHPATARFISTKLARRFVSDTPPDDLVRRMTDTFRQSDGDLRAVMTVLLTSNEFLSPGVERAKVKNPFEFLVSALRAAGADISDARPLVRTMQQLGMPLYQCQPPTGYKDSADTWVNTGALVNRMNVALMLASGRTPGISLRDVGSADALAGGELSDATRATIAKAQGQSQAIALALGSPEFQRR
jgi:uncharacterized protein (DUF1800 family)